MKTQMGSEELAAKAWEVGHTHDPYTTRSRSQKTFEASDGTVFEKLGHGADRVALLGPDGVVYKVSHRGAWGIAQAQCEMDLFGYLESLNTAWCPDYWPYTVDPEESTVIAMKRYDKIDYESVNEENTTLYDIMREMDYVSNDVDVDNMGIDPDTGQIVLLDGGISHYQPGVTDEYIKQVM